jgi:hypothetical protein
LLFKVNIFKTQVLYFLFKLDCLFFKIVDQFTNSAINSEIINSKNIQLHSQFPFFLNNKNLLASDFNVDILNSIPDESFFE